MLHPNSDPDAYILPVSDTEELLQRVVLGGATSYTDLVAFFTSIHAENVKAGWWSDLETGARKNRNFGELAALIWSEIGEAITASGPDDKLPIYEGEIVEIADATIRLADLFGSGTIGSVHDAAHSVMYFLEERRAGGQSVRTETCTSLWLDFFEDGRKGRKDVLPSAARLFAYLIRAGEVFTANQRVRPASMTVAPIWTVIAAKLAFNRIRPDHKVHNRKAVGGKKI